MAKVCDATHKISGYLSGLFNKKLSGSAKPKNSKVIIIRDDISASVRIIIKGQFQGLK